MNRPCPVARHRANMEAVVDRSIGRLPGKAGGRRSGARPLLLALLSALTLAAGSAGAAVYHVSPSGDDSAAGSEAAPWRTIQNAANIVLPGDTIVLGNGTFAQRVLLTRSGAAGAPITLRKADGATPVIDGASLGGGVYDALVNLAGVAHVVVDGLVIRNSSGFGLALTGNTRNALVTGVEVTGSKGAGAIWVEGATSASFSSIRNCLIHDNDGGGITLWDSPGGYYLIEDNRVWNNLGTNNFDGIQVGSQAAGLHHVAVRRNTVYDNGANNQGADNIDMGGHTACHHYLMEGNDAWGSTGALKMHGQPPYATVARFNRSTGHGFVEYDYPNPAMIYNNTMVNTKNGLHFHTDDLVGGNGVNFAGMELRNNLVYGATNYLLLLTGPGGYKFDLRWSSLKLDGNAYRFYDYGYRGGILWDPRTFAPQSPDPTGPSEFAAYQAANAPDRQDVRSRRITADIGAVFTDPSNKDYRLAAGSPAIDAGVELTTTTTLGTSSTTISVVRASFFHDDWGGLVAPDWVRVGANPAVRIVAVNDDGNTIEVATPISWAPGDAVNLPFEGTAPDAGAFESGSGAPPAPTLLGVQPLPS